MQSPHDTLFRFTFAHAMQAASWLRGVVPMELGAVIDWSSLAPANERLPGLRLRPHFADLVFWAARMDGGPPLLLLVEHKSRMENGLERQLLRYAVLLQHAWQQRANVVPDVLAVLLVHGEGEAAPRPSVEGPFADWQPRLPFVIDDLRHRDERRLADRILLPLPHLTLLCLMQLPHLEPDDVPRAFERWQELLRAVDHADGPPLTPPLGASAVDAIGWYALAVTDVPPEVLSDTFARILHRPEDTIMSTLERTFQKGLAAGKAEGLAIGKAEGVAVGKAEGVSVGKAAGLTEGKADTLLRILHKRFAQLPATAEARIRSATLADLDRWTDRVLDAATIEELFAD